MKIAFVGLGSQFQSDYYPFLKNLPNFIQIVALCDIDIKKSKFAKNLNVAFYEDYKSMLSKEKIDLLVLILPHFIYFDVIQEAAKKQIHIFQEKPFATNIQQALQLIEIQKQFNIQIFTVSKRRENQLYQFCKQSLYKIGKIKKIFVNHVLDIKDPLKGWRGSIHKSKGGCILDLGYHMIDIINWFFGLPDKVFSKQNIAFSTNIIENSAFILFEYTKQEIEGQLFINRNHYKKKEEIIILGSNSYILLNNKVLKIGNDLHVLSQENTKNKKLTFFSFLNFCNKIKNKTCDTISSNREQLLNVVFIEACYNSMSLKSLIETQKIMKNYEKIKTSNIQWT